MPIYEYICENCGEEFEKLTSLATAHLAQDCPNCDKPDGKRIMSVSSVGGNGERAGSNASSCGSSGFG